ncbi:hypothetical protein BG011_003981 [Mortierella polycephala]|uniref:C2H2-type domain-containing protein n=1 Tax=Mortierella polycephala TaxID=41804 RepID=A0A9P6U9Y1_9FUNG|nr:hypothetical protein BG011_003981 [Mortierella polycephala]
MDTSSSQQPLSNQTLERINKEMQSLSSSPSSIDVFLAEMNTSEQARPAFQFQSPLNFQAPQQHYQQPSPSQPSSPMQGSMHFNGAPLFGLQTSPASLPSSSSVTLNTSLQHQSAPDTFSSRMMVDSSSYYMTPQPQQQVIPQPEPLAALSREESPSIASTSHLPSPPFRPSPILSSVIPGQNTNSMILDDSINKGESSSAGWVWDATYQPSYTGTGGPALQNHIHQQEMQQQHQMSLHNPHRIECAQESPFEDPQFHHREEEFMSPPAPPTLSVQLAEDSFWQSSDKNNTGSGLNPLDGSIPSVLFEPMLGRAISATSSLTSSPSATDSASTSLSASPRRSKSATNTGKIRRRSSKPIQAMLSSSHASGGSGSNRSRSYSIASTPTSLSFPNSFSTVTGTISTSLPGSGRAGAEIRGLGYPSTNDNNGPNAIGIDMATSLSIGMNMRMSNLRSPTDGSAMEQGFGTLDLSDDTLFPSTMAVSATTSHTGSSSLMDADVLDFDLNTLLSTSTGFQSSSFMQSFSRSAASTPSPSTSPSSSPPMTLSSMACHPSTSPIMPATKKATGITTAATIMVMTPTPTVKRILLPPLLPCPISGCKKSFARSYNLNTHLKTQHNLNPHDLGSTLSVSSPPSSSTTTAVAASSFSSPQPASSSITISAPVSVTQSSSGATEVSNTTPTTPPLRPFPCHLCPRIFSRKHDLQRHIRVHTGSKPYVCMNCQKAFARTDALCRHYKVEEACRVLAGNSEVDEDVRMLQQNHAQQTLQLEVKELRKAQKLRSQQQQQQMFQQKSLGSANMDFF